MGSYLNRVSEDYIKLTKMDYYVDKTNFISLINNLIEKNHNCIAVTRARRFGKTLTCQMLRTYYCKDYDSKELFSNLKICKNKSNDQNVFLKHLNRYNVLFLNISNLLNSMQSDKKNNLGNYISNAVFDELNRTYNDCIFEKDKNQLYKLLDSIYQNEKNKFVIIIDEWDAPFRNIPKNKRLQEEYLSFLENLFKSDESNDYLILGYITGILPIKQYATTHSKLNSFYEYTMADPKDSATYVGFTQDEVKNLCNKFNLSFDEMRKWYDGYSFKSEKNIYNPNSVIEAITFKDIVSYWGQTGTFESIKDAIDLNLADLKIAISNLLSDLPVEVNTKKFKNDIVNINSKDEALTLLIHLGYLSYDIEKSTVKIPNLEIAEQFQLAITDNNDNYKELAKALNQSDKLLSYTIKKDEEVVAKLIEEIHDDTASLFNYNNEDTLAAVISIAYYTAKKYYETYKDIASGKGRADLIFKPYNTTLDKPAMIIELKINKSTDSAIKQIKEKHYIDGLKNYRGKVLLIGINYDKVSKTHSCKIDEIKI